MSFQDMKFVQAEVKQFTAFAVVTRFKRDFLQFSKRGSRVISNVDQRVTLQARGAFKKTEHFVVQVLKSITFNIEMLLGS